jgi:alpha-1,6-mannosyltransferase
MRILQLANFYGERSGGLRTAVDALGAGYVAAGHRVMLVVPARRHDVVEEGRRTVIKVRSPLVPGMGGYRAILDRWVVTDVVSSFRPDVVELSDKTTLVRSAAVAGRHGIPTALISHERLDEILRPRVPDWFPLQSATDRWNRRVVAQVDRVVCASRFAADEFRRLGISGVEHVPLGVDLEAFTPRSRGATARGAPAMLVLVGRLSAEKCPEVAVDVLRQLTRSGRRVRLVIAGDGPERGRIERLAAGLDVELLGHVADRARLAAVIASADVALAPSPYETFGLAALEAMACGTPVVAVDRGAVGELVGSGGRVVPRHAMAAAVETLLDGDRGASRLAARQRAEQFSWATTTDRLLAVYSELARRTDRVGRLGPVGGLLAG